MNKIPRHKTPPVAAVAPKPSTWLKYERVYGLFAVGILLLTTLYWAILAAHVHQHNADQLIDPYLFEHASTFHQAIFPGQHSFLVKWPIFLLVALCGSSASAFTVATVSLSLLTVGLFTAILYRIERRPLVFGTLCLGLASVLLLIPAEPYPGALLPLNMGMISTRNIEYVIYIIALIFVVRAPRLISWKSGLAILTLGILVASDKLFLTISLGGALASASVYFIGKRDPYKRLTFRWLILGLASGILAFGILQLITLFHLTNLNSGSGLGPYALVHSVKDLALGGIYGLLGLFTNLGANPAYDATMIKSIPGTAYHNLASLVGIAYLANIAIALIGIYTFYHILRTSLRPSVRVQMNKVPHSLTLDTPLHLSILLIWSTLAALAAFIASNHYYVVDARYLAIVTFTLFVASVTYLRQVQLSTRVLIGIGVVLICSIAIGSISAWQTHNRSIMALSATGQQNDTIASALRQHSVATLLGDYWRVAPIKLETRQSQNILPLENCTTPRDILTSSSWEKDATRHSFAYLLTTEKSITGYPACTIDQVVATYGRPSGSQLISGTMNNPKEILLFYDYGANTYTHYRGAVSSSIIPRSISQIADKPCDGSTIMNVVAHQDDDILFMNPNVIHQINKGACIRSVYLTAGDSGSSKLYWLSREEGSKAAYATMFHLKNPQWTTRSVAISESKLVTVTSLKDDPRIVLVFMHLPDGNTSGKGFPATHQESLAKLRDGTIPRIHTVDGQASYTTTELVSALSILMEAYRPTEIQTMATTNFSSHYPDHSDHLNTGAYTQLAYTQYTQQNPALPLKFYIGYPIHDRPENVTGQDLADTEAAFFAYAQHDKGTCNSVAACKKMSYIYYLNRQYQVNP